MSDRFELEYHIEVFLSSWYSCLLSDSFAVLIVGLAWLIKSLSLRETESRGRPRSNAPICASEWDNGGVSCEPWVSSSRSMLLTVPSLMLYYAIMLLDLISIATSIRRAS